MNSQVGPVETRFRIQTGLQWRWCLGGVVVLGADDADALHIGPPAAHWFALLQRPVTLADLVDATHAASHSGVLPIGAMNDTLDVLTELCDRELVTVVAGQSAAERDRVFPTVPERARPDEVTGGGSGFGSD